MAIIGAILGDISGSQYEFGRPIDLDWKHCELFTDRCIFTDDTVMTLAAKLAIIKGDSKYHISSFADYYRIYGNKYPNVGYGGCFETWLRHNDTKAYNSYGNGSAMRVSYVGEYFDNEKDVIKYATKSAECTHNHPEGIKGAVVTAMCIFMAKTGATKPEIYEYVKKNYPKEDYRYGVEYKLDEYKDKYQWNETCQGSVPVAIRCFLESDDYESFLRNVYSLRCDMDTLCAIGGGIAEEFYKGTGFDDETLLKHYLSRELYRIVIM